MSLQEFRGVVLLGMLISLLILWLVNGHYPSPTMIHFSAATPLQALLLAVDTVASGIAVDNGGSIFRRVRRARQVDWFDLGTVTMSLIWTGLIFACEYMLTRSIELSKWQCLHYSFILIGTTPMEEMQMLLPPIRIWAQDRLQR